MDQDNDVIIDKVRKLLALSKSPNKEEAARAAEKARDMVIKYNLSIGIVAAGSEVSLCGQVSNKTRMIKR